MVAGNGKMGEKTNREGRENKKEDANIKTVILFERVKGGSCQGGLGGGGGVGVWGGSQDGVRVQVYRGESVKLRKRKLGWQEPKNLKTQHWSQKNGRTVEPPKANNNVGPL